MGLKNTIEILKKGGIIIYPTETFYAIGCIITWGKAIHKIYLIKKRPFNKPLPIIIGDICQLKKITDYNDPAFLKLIKHFWPGPLSILVPANRNISSYLTDSKMNICVRMTSHPIARKLSIACDLPLISTSANLSDMPPPSRPQLVDKNLLSKVDHIITIPPFPKGEKPSTIIKILSHQKVELIREGAIPKEDIKLLGFEVV